eukprot:m.625092 g.625092  ORF g.625092 m.625092 type:complete len:302 (-) comp22547_c0_seq2:972-1877(-)
MASAQIQCSTLRTRAFNRTLTTWDGLECFPTARRRSPPTLAVAIGGVWKRIKTTHARSTPDAAAALQHRGAPMTSAFSVPSSIGVTLPLTRTEKRSCRASATEACWRIVRHVRCPTGCVRWLPWVLRLSTALSSQHARQRPPCRTWDCAVLPTRTAISSARPVKLGRFKTAATTGRLTCRTPRQRQRVGRSTAARLRPSGAWLRTWATGGRGMRCHRALACRMQTTSTPLSTSCSGLLRWSTCSTTRTCPRMHSRHGAEHYAIPYVYTQYLSNPVFIQRTKRSAYHPSLPTTMHHENAKNK